jgi:hypothetical protein
MEVLITLVLIGLVFMLAPYILGAFMLAVGFIIAIIAALVAVFESFRRK